MEHFTGPQVSMKPSQKSPTLAASAQSINRFLLEKVTRTKTKKGEKKEIKHLMIESIPLSPFFIYPSAHPPQRAPTHLAHPQYSQKVISLKSAHIALSVIKMNCWCASAWLHKCAKSDGTLLACERMPSVRRMCLSLMYSHRVQCWQGGATLNRSRAWQVSKHCGETAQKLTSPRC